MIQLGTVVLSDNMLWTDEFEVDPVAQVVTRTLGGGQVIEESALQGGRPITLGGGAAWVSRTTVLALETLAAQVGQVHTLTLHSRTFSVAFRRPIPIVAVPLLPNTNPGGTALYDLTLRLIEV